MILDLTGNTVTQAINTLRETLRTCTEEELIAKTDNETVKLNVYSLVHRMGYACKAERVGPYHHVVIPLKTEGGEEAVVVSRDDAGAAAARETATAFPVGHMSGEDRLEPPVRREGIRQRAKAAARRKPEVQDAPASENHPDEHLHHTSWLILQTDQIGNRDSRLGFEILEDLLVHLDTSRFEGIFLVHRAVTLLDPAYLGGRGLRVLLRKNLPILACEKSVAYYKLEDKVAKPVEAAPFHYIFELAAHHDLVWV